jgi:N-acetylneuraminic acid mutarotase
MLLKSKLAIMILILTLMYVGLLSITSTIWAQESWTQKADMPTARFWLSCEVVDNKIYAIGGTEEEGPSLSIVEVYDPASDTWDTTKAGMPTGRRSMASAVVDGKIYIIGGDPKFIRGVTTGVRTVEVYDPITDTWDTTKTDMETAREATSASVVNGIIYVIGGVAPGGVFLKSVEAYDPVTDTWTKKKSMRTTRARLSTCVVDGKIYAIGGGAQAIGKMVEEYDPVTDTWAPKASLPVSNSYFGACVVDNIIYICGGNAGSRVFAYDAVTDEWLEKAAMPKIRYGLSAEVVNGNIYAIGGGVGWPPSPLSIVEKYDPTSDTTTSVQDLYSERIPTEFLLHQNYPNPFNPSTNIKFALPKQETVKIEVYSIIGQKIETLLNKPMPAGYHEVEFNGQNLSSGVYFYRIETGEFQDVKKMILLK